MSTLIGILASVIATWVVAHIYYHRGTRDLQRIIDNLDRETGRGATSSSQVRWSAVDGLTVHSPQRQSGEIGWMG